MIITFDGIDGSGKTTQIALLAKALRARGHEVVIASDLNDSEAGRTLKNVINSRCGNNDHVSDLLAICCARIINIDDVVRPTVDKGAILIQDRYQASTYAYNYVGRSIPDPVYRGLSDFIDSIISVDCSILLNLTPELATERLLNRRGGLDKYERLGAGYFQSVSSALLEYAERKGLHVVDASGSIDSVAALVLDTVLAELQRVASTTR